MGKCTVKRFWCVTYYGNLTPCARDEIFKFFLRDLSFEIQIGSPESDERGLHHACYVKCKSRTVTKSRAKEAWNHRMCDNQLTGSERFEPLSTTPARYVDRMFKSKALVHSEEIDQFISDAVDYIRNEMKFRNPSQHLTQYVIKTKGLSYYCKHKAVIEEAKLHPEVMKENMSLEFDVNDEDISYMTFRIVSKFIENLFAQYGDEKCFVDRPYRGPFEKLDKTNQVNHVLLSTLLPFLVKRTYQDNLRGLAFWGGPQTGKSHMFVGSKFHRRVASDANGVSRFKLMTGETAFLLDDCSNETLLDHSNAITIKQLALGQEATVKIHGTTQNVRAFVVLTTNEELFFCQNHYSDPRDKRPNETRKNIMAWRRRFTTFKMDVPCEIDEETCSLNLDRTITAFTLRHIWIQTYEKSDPGVQSLFSRYKNFIASMPVDSETQDVVEAAYLKISKNLESTGRPESEKLCIEKMSETEKCVSFFQQTGEVTVIGERITER